MNELFVFDVNIFVLYFNLIIIVLLLLLQQVNMSDCAKRHYYDTSVFVIWFNSDTLLCILYF